MELIVYPLLSTRSKRCFVRRHGMRRQGEGRIYHYKPKEILISRLQQQLGLSRDAVLKQVFKERLYLLKQIYGEDKIHEGYV